MKMCSRCCWRQPFRCNKGLWCCHCLIKEIVAQWVVYGHVLMLPFRILFMLNSFQPSTARWPVTRCRVWSPGVASRRCDVIPPSDLDTGHGLWPIDHDPDVDHHRWPLDHTGHYICPLDSLVSPILTLDLLTPPHVALRPLDQAWVTP